MASCSITRQAVIAASATMLTIMTPTPAPADAASSRDQSTKQVLQPVPFTQVEINDTFWAPRLETNRSVSLPHSLEMLKKAGNLKNLRLAAEGKHDGYEGPYYIDSDLYKAVEAISFSLATHPDPELEARLDEVIQAIADAQQPDGYLNTWIQVVAPDQRWKDLRNRHELYCAGHLIEAAVAHHAATGKRTLLDVAIKFADYIDSVFGDAPGKRMGYPGHEEIELALMKLWRTTGEQRYFDLSKFFLDNRGTGFFAKEHNQDLKDYNGEYWQDNVPVRDTRRIVGHAVRAVYLLSGATDLAMATGEPALTDMLFRVWDNTTGGNMYITGGIGSSAKNEGFTRDYDLPNFAAYQETCASVAMMMWNQRMNLMTGESKYADALERAMFNGFLSGVSLDGTKFFYVNPLASRGHHHRAEWYSCACCPPNVTRTLAQLGGYLYATSPGSLWVNQYVGGKVNAQIDGTTVSLEVKTDYPWDGRVAMKTDVPALTQFALRLRIPEWCSGAQVTVNDELIAEPVYDNGYLVIDRQWAPGDEAVLTMPMPVRQVAAHDQVIASSGKLATRRGPLIYCLEECDQSVPVHGIAIRPGSDFEAKQQPELLGGVVTLHTNAQVSTSASNTTAPALYRKSDSATSAPVSLIPYYAWDNRSPGNMAVWIPTFPPSDPLEGPEDSATVTMSFLGKGGRLNGCRDGFEIENSLKQYGSSSHWWPHKGGTEWLQYTWDTPQQISKTSVYWLDDTGHGECRVPQSWRIEYRDGENWKPVSTKSEYPTAVDQWCEVQFEPVNTKELRLVVEMQTGFAAGVHEWRL